MTHHLKSEVEFECRSIEKWFGNVRCELYDFSRCLSFMVLCISTFLGTVRHAVRTYGNGSIHPGDTVMALSDWFLDDGVSKSENSTFLRLGKQISAEKRYERRLQRTLTDNERLRLGHWF